MSPLQGSKDIGIADAAVASTGSLHPKALSITKPPKDSHLSLYAISVNMKLIVQAVEAAAAHETGRLWPQR